MKRKYVVKAHISSNLYFKCFDEIKVVFELDDLLGWEDSIMVFDTWEEAKGVARVFNGYVKEWKR